MRKGRGTVYACQSMLYRQVQKEGNTSYLKCCTEPCDGLAKQKNGQFTLGVSRYVYNVACCQYQRQYYLHHSTVVECNWGFWIL